MAGSHRCALLLFPLLFGSADAADLGTCNAIEDSAARLACYDAAAGRTVKSASEAPRTPAPAAAPAPAPAASQAEFGMNEEMKRKSRGEKEPAVEALRSKISSARLSGLGHYTLTLANGQRWYVADSGASLRFEEGESVEIHQGSFGSFHLLRPAGGRAVRVRRVE